ncbi:hypothetical protein M0R45_037454 [Rubus argutus]|uniref:START domain-containing protein n=1 Tax=Rubus argutus TaxID=59490 RepID=A0AAW1VZ15_RUBAR
MSQRGGVAPYFQSEASRHSATIRVKPDHHRADADGFPAREAQFVRYSHQQLDGSWIIVDVSVDEWRQFQRPSTRSICRKRPSGCLIRDLQNGSSFVTWVENVDVRDKTEALHPKLTPFVESGYAFGARRWISNLQVQAERFIYSTGINTSPSDSPISPEGRRSLAITAKRMVISFCSDVCNSTFHNWSSSNKTREKNMEVKTNKRRGDPGKPPGLHSNCRLHDRAHFFAQQSLRLSQRYTEPTSVGTYIHQ